MTLAPRIEVYTKLACRALHENAPSSPSSPPIYNFTNPTGILADIHPTPHLTTLTFPNPAYSFDECSADPKVQGRAARIQASVKTTESVLSAITTGWLSHLGDLYGRKKILSLSVFGALFMDFVYILVSDENSLFGRHGEGFIIAAPLIEGFLGAQSTYNGITHAYATDCTPDGSRAQIFVMMQGMLYVGLASGPWLNGAVLNLVNSSTTVTLFALAIVIALCNLVFVILILPESLPRHRRLHSRSSTGYSHRASGSHFEPPQRRPKSIGRVLKKTFTSIVTQLIRPISLFFPVPLDRGRKGRNWNLTLTGIALFIYVLSIQVYNLKYLYVKHVYDWSSERLGYYMSLLWITRAINLLVLLPAVLSYFAPDRPRANARSSPTHLAAAIRFDRFVAALSFFTDASANALVVLSPTSSQVLFILFISLNSVTSGGNPALHSLGAVSMQAMGKGEELGLVFGALGVVNAVAHIVAPGIYAAIYGATVAEFPKAMFVMSAILLYTAVILLLGVRPYISVPPDDGEYQPAPEDEDAVEEVEEGEESGASSGEGTRGRASLRDSHEAARRASINRVSISEETL
ncbi:major facilitator superfamily domain-containing protein [Amylostereum chailletii]|nr:major facilitator superfamily domain-containing protein [Amylostereum chailletii]